MIIKAGPNPATYPSGANNQTEVNAWTQGAAAAFALQKTALTYQDWLTATFNNWLTNYQDWKVNEPAPQPPNGWDAYLPDDYSSGCVMIDSGAPSGPMPSYAKRATPAASGSIVKPNPTSGALLIGAVGTKVTQFDGTVWQRVS
jgi:hypothetical protein